MWSNQKFVILFEATHINTSDDIKRYLPNDEYPVIFPDESSKACFIYMKRKNHGDNTVPQYQMEVWHEKL